MVLRRAAQAAPVEVAEHALREHHLVGGRGVEPLEGLGQILGRARAVEIDEAQVDLRRPMAALRRAQQMLATARHVDGVARAAVEALALLIVAVGGLLGHRQRGHGRAAKRCREAQANESANGDHWSTKWESV